MSAIAKALFKTFFQSWNNPSSSSISFMLYSNCCVVFLLVFFRRFDGYFHILLKIIVSSCVTYARTLKKKLIDFDIVTTIFSGFNSNELVSKCEHQKALGLGHNAKERKVCTVDLDPGEAPSFYESEEEEEEERRRQRQKMNIQCKDIFETLIQKQSEYEEDNGSFDETLAFWRRKEMEEIMSRKKLKY